ncbi:hypothetical protein DEO72_LG2g4222 [Vigna unguiculata]|uniref:Uncharacterized protein n=1 Tax=Vigna unguiculata TaxID=3917 RepID=A0A4D6L615_VIGUN|nr:hypothetical protein DEO72_LG2g4222 [Vigna unguiculata]
MGNIFISLGYNHLGRNNDCFNNGTRPQMLPQSRSGSVSENASASGPNAASDRRGGEESIEDGGINSARLFREPSPSLWQRASGVITTISSFIHGRDSNITEVPPVVSDIIVGHQNNQDYPSSSESQQNNQDHPSSSEDESASGVITRISRFNRRRDSNRKRVWHVVSNSTFREQNNQDDRTNSVKFSRDLSFSEGERDQSSSESERDQSFSEGESASNVITRIPRFNRRRDSNIRRVRRVVSYNIFHEQNNEDDRTNSVRLSRPPSSSEGESASSVITRIPRFNYRRDSNRKRVWRLVSNNRFGKQNNQDDNINSVKLSRDPSFSEGESASSEITRIPRFNYRRDSNRKRVWRTVSNNTFGEQNNQDDRTNSIRLSKHPSSSEGESASSVITRIPRFNYKRDSNRKRVWRLISNNTFGEQNNQDDRTNSVRLSRHPSSSEGESASSVITRIPRFNYKRDSNRKRVWRLVSNNTFGKQNNQDDRTNSVRLSRHPSFSEGESASSVITRIPRFNYRRDSNRKRVWRLLSNNTFGEQNNRDDNTNSVKLSRDPSFSEGESASNVITRIHRFNYRRDSNKKRVWRTVSGEQNNQDDKTNSLKWFSDDHVTFPFSDEE